MYVYEPVCVCVHCASVDGYKFYFDLNAFKILEILNEFLFSIQAIQ